MATVSVDGGFEWDSEKAASNLVKHGVSFDEAVTVLMSDTAVESANLVDGNVETVGFSIQARALLVVTTERGNTRIISARKASKQEAKRLGK